MPDTKPPVAPSEDIVHAEVDSLRPLARQKIKEGELPAEPIPEEQIERLTYPRPGPYVPGSKPSDLCRLCGAPISQDVISWRRLPHPLSKTYPREGTKPELHAACYTAWRAEAEAAVATRVDLRLLPAPDDPSTDSPEFQRTLGKFNEFLAAAPGIEFEQSHLDPARAHGFQSAEYVLRVTSVGVPSLGQVLGAWIKSRAKRGVVVEFADVHIEPKCAEDVRELLQSIEEHRAERHG